MIGSESGMIALVVTWAELSVDGTKVSVADVNVSVKDVSEDVNVSVNDESEDVNVSVDVVITSVGGGAESVESAVSVVVVNESVGVENTNVVLSSVDEIGTSDESVLVVGGVSIDVVVESEELSISTSTQLQC